MEQFSPSHIANVVISSFSLDTKPPKPNLLSYSYRNWQPNNPSTTLHHHTSLPTSLAWWPWFLSIYYKIVCICIEYKPNSNKITRSTYVYLRHWNDSQTSKWHKHLKKISIKTATKPTTSTPSLIFTPKQHTTTYSKYIPKKFCSVRGEQKLECVKQSLKNKDIEVW